MSLSRSLQFPDALPELCDVSRRAVAVLGEGDGGWCRAGVFGKAKTAEALCEMCTESGHVCTFFTDLSVFLPFLSRGRLGSGWKGAAWRPVLFVEKVRLLV
jgi:hypothetical protein